jgi:ribosomal protein L3
MPLSLQFRIVPNSDLNRSGIRKRGCVIEPGITAPSARTLWGMPMPGKFGAERLTVDPIMPAGAIFLGRAR